MLMPTLEHPPPLSWSPAMLARSVVALFLSLSVVAVPLTAPNTLSNPHTLSFSKRVNSTGSANVLKQDQARAQALRERAQPTAGYSFLRTQKDSDFNDPAISQAVSYVVNVAIGTPPETYSLVVDTGSSNTWIGAGKNPGMSSTAKMTGDFVSNMEVDSSWACYEIEDIITLTNGLSFRTLFPSFTKCIPTVLDNARNARCLGVYEIGISFQPSMNESDPNGELTFGGVDKTEYIEPLNYVPITSTSPASDFFGIDQSVSYGDTTILSLTAGIVDTGTTLILLATDAFKKYQDATGAKLDSTTGLLRINNKQYSELKALNFVVYEVIPNAQIWPRELNTALGGTKDGIYLIVGDLGSSSGSGLDFIIGMSFLERFYSVYDVGNKRVGFAKTKYTNAETN
ncbi:Polyporopepsin [Grifola frondosa]|uniref:Polyporopepsin n=1 Tax=Grifola frondosa TaxID=5627 RepID=A0A1C7MPK8_GRIFR|nr:Polyporopepsin [Grifola frondosa]